MAAGDESGGECAFGGEDPDPGVAGVGFRVRDAGEEFPGGPEGSAEGAVPEEQGILHTLRGICRLQGQPVSLRFPTALREPEGRILEKSYYKCLHLRREYLARSAAGEFAQAYGILADRAGEQSARILRLLGML